MEVNVKTLLEVQKEISQMSELYLERQARNLMGHTIIPNPAEVIGPVPDVVFMVSKRMWERLEGMKNEQGRIGSSDQKSNLGGESSR